MTADVVVVFAPNWLGDAVMALPAIADIRRHFASARLVVAARASVARLFELVPGVDSVVTLQWRGRPFARRLLAADVTALRTACAPGAAIHMDTILTSAGIDPTPTDRRQGDHRQSAPVVAGRARSRDAIGSSIAVLLPNSFAAAWLARRAGVPERWGYATDWRGRLLTRAVAVPRGSVHQGRYYQHLTEALDIPAGPLEPRIDVSNDARREAHDLLVAAGWDGRQPLLAMAPGAAYGTAKRWLPSHFARVVVRAAADHGLRTVLVGSAADAETIRIIAADPAVAAVHPIDLAGQTTLHGLAGVLAASLACVSNDSGAMHLAGAIGTPIIAIFGPTRETETAPLTRAGGRREILINPVWCRPCMLRECPIDHRCMTGLSPDRVLDALRATVAGDARA